MERLRFINNLSRQSHGKMPMPIGIICFPPWHQTQWLDTRTHTVQLWAGKALSHSSGKWLKRALGVAQKRNKSRSLPTMAWAIQSRLWLIIWKRRGRDQNLYAKPTIAVTVSVFETIGLLVASFGKKLAVTFTNALTERDRS